MLFSIDFCSFPLSVKQSISISWSELKHAIVNYLLKGTDWSIVNRIWSNLLIHIGRVLPVLRKDIAVSSTSWSSEPTLVVLRHVVARVVLHLLELMWAHLVVVWMVMRHQAVLIHISHHLWWWCWVRIALPRSISMASVLCVHVLLLMVQIVLLSWVSLMWDWVLMTDSILICQTSTEARIAKSWILMWTVCLRIVQIHLWLQ